MRPAVPYPSRDRPAGSKRNRRSERQVNDDVDAHCGGYTCGGVQLLRGFSSRRFLACDYALDDVLERGRESILVPWPTSPNTEGLPENSNEESVDGFHLHLAAAAALVAAFQAMNGRRVSARFAVRHNESPTEGLLPTRDQGYHSTSTPTMYPVTTEDESA